MGLKLNKQTIWVQVDAHLPGLFVSFSPCEEVEVKFILVDP